MIMTGIPASHPRMMSALRKVAESHKQMHHEISDHARKHDAEIDAKRRKLEENARVSNGIAAANAKVQGS